MTERCILSVLREWREEGIPSVSIDLPDYSSILELMHRPLSGIFEIIDDTSIRSELSVPSFSEVLNADKILLEKLSHGAGVTSAGARNTLFALAGPTSAYRRTELDFVIRHTFGSVVYSCCGFVDANRYGVSTNLAESLGRTSTDAFISLLFSGETLRGTSAVSPTVFQRWKADLDALCGRLTSSPSLHIVQCIKVCLLLK